MAEWRERLADALSLHEFRCSSELQPSCCTCGEAHEAFGQHLADVVLSLLEEETHWGPVSVPEFHPDGSPVMDDGSERGFILATPVPKHHFEWLTRRRWVSPWEDAGPRETSAELSRRLEQDHQS